MQLQHTNSEITKSSITGLPPTQEKTVVQFSTDEEHVKACRSLCVAGARYFGCKRYFLNVFGRNQMRYYVMFSTDPEAVPQLIEAARGLFDTFMTFPSSVFFSASDVVFPVPKAKLSLHKSLSVSSRLDRNRIFRPRILSKTPVQYGSIRLKTNQV